ncbi:hypothetical protein EQV77_08835 [Halobacillus fulvus]|nr:hypothetical protein EQV77_08835 [Halobacillus fulvus]
MFYLLFALFFTGYVLIGWFTDFVELSSFAMMISIAFVFGNIYMFFKEQRNKKKQEGESES